jgi:hypothetical protein
MSRWDATNIAAVRKGDEKGSNPDRTRTDSQRRPDTDSISQPGQDPDGITMQTGHRQDQSNPDRTRTDHNADQTQTESNELNADGMHSVSDLRLAVPDAKSAAKREGSGRDWNRSHDTRESDTLFAAAGRTGTIVLAAVVAQLLVLLLLQGMRFGPSQLLAWNALRFRNGAG